MLQIIKLSNLYLCVRNKTQYVSLALIRELKPVLNENIHKFTGKIIYYR